MYMQMCPITQYNFTCMYIRVHVYDNYYIHLYVHVHVHVIIHNYTGNINVNDRVFLIIGSKLILNNMYVDIFFYNSLQE